MTHPPSLFVLLVVLLFGGAGRSDAQTPAEERAHLISIYRVAPGKHLDFLKWQAEREAIGREAEAPPTQWYVHEDGDSWDFISIAAAPDAGEQARVDERIEALARERDLTTGFAAALEFRQFVSSHTDTYASGPFSAQELVEQASGR